MYNQRSPPKYKNNYMGGSETSSVDLLSLNSSGSSASLLLDGNKKYCVNYNPQNAHQHHHYYGSRGNRSTTHTAVNSKRNKRHWGNKDRAGMSFLIVIAFFAIFGLIILTEVFMIDERSHAGMISVRHGNTMGRLGDSMPDYDNVKDDYDVLEDNLLSDHKLGYVQMRDNKFKIQEVEGSNGNRVAGLLLSPNDNGLVGAGIGMSIGGAPPANVPIIPWGKVLPGKIEESLPHFPKGMQITDGSWQIVNGTRFKFFVFSAYYDRREGSKLVRVIGATKTRGPERVWCRFWYEAKRNITAAGVQIDKRGNRVTSVTVMARVKVIRENWNLKYSACFVLCPVRSPDLQVPNYISIVSRLRTPPGNLLLVRNTDWDVDFTHVETNITQQALHNTTSFASATNSLIEPLKHIPDKIAVCVKPFHFNYDQAFFLMEYLELYTLLGVSHFTFYNHTVGPHAACVLDHYARGDVPSNLTAWDLEPATPAEIAKYKENLASGATIKPPRHLTSSNYVQPTVTILPWNLRMRSQKEIRTEGLFAALNDCVYRSMYRYRYLALVDLDEFIVPRYNDTLKELLDSLNKRFRNRNTGAYSFQNAFFYLQFPDDTLVMQQTSVPNVDPRVRATLVTQRKTKRRFKLHPQKQRSKYICKPEAVIEAGNHFVWEFSPNKGSLNVPPTEAILQHYRVCEFGGNDCIKAPSVVDRTAMKYVNRLVQRVNFVYQHLRGPCKLPELPTTARQQDTTEDTNTKTMEEVKKSPTEETTTNNELRKTKTSTNAQTINTAEKATLKPDVNKRKRKVVIFEADDTGVMKARVEFSKKIRT